MKIIINITLIIILALCVWGGFRHGLIRSIAGLLAVILAMVGGSLLADRFAKELVPAISPFVSGYIDGEDVTTAVREKLGYADSDYSLNDILQQDPSLRYDYSYECLREIGFCKDVSIDLAKDCVSVSEKNNISQTDAVVTVVCNSVSYVGCITVAFLMILILLNAIIDMLNINMKLPKLEILDEVGGSTIGLLKGFLFCVLLSWFLGFLGLIIGKETSDNCALLTFFQAFRFITRSLI